VIQDLDIRLLRHFVAVAEDLHFTRAAARLFVTQQCLSRDVRKLEDGLGTRLLDRTSRRVTLTPDGERLLRLAGPLISRHDQLLDQFRTHDPVFTVDVVGEGITPALILTAARRHEDGFEYYTHFGPSLDDSLARLASRTLDAAFGLLDDATLGPEIRRRPVHEDPLGLLIPAEHPLAGSHPLAMAELRGLVVCHLAGNHVTPEWERVARRLLDTWAAQPLADHPPVRGADDLANHLRRRTPMLVPVAHPRPPGTVLRELVDPVPVLRWSMFWHERTDHPALDALRRTVDEFATVRA